MTENNNKRPDKVSATAKSNTGIKWIIIILILIIALIVQGIFLYKNYREQVETENALAQSEEDLASSLQDLRDIERELEEKILEIEKLGGDVTELEKAKAEVEAELRSSKTRDGRAIVALKDKVQGLQELLKLKDEQIEKLKEANDELVTENYTLKTEKSELNNTIQEISQSKEELESKVALASRLKAENFKIIAINKKGRERDMPVRSKHLEKLKVIFKLAENNVAPIEGKTILIRVIDSNGQVIFDVDKGSGTFMHDNKEAFYTAGQDILFDNTGQQLVFEYVKGSGYDEGKYLLEVYTEGYKMGSTTFEVR